MHSKWNMARKLRSRKICFSELLLAVIRRLARYSNDSVMEHYLPFDVFLSTIAPPNLYLVCCDDFSLSL